MINITYDRYIEILQKFVGRKVKSISEATFLQNADEGLTIIFDDDSFIWIGFSGEEGTVCYGNNLSDQAI